MLNSYFAKVQLIKAQSNSKFEYNKNSVFEYIFRYISLYTTPFFILIKLSPNKVSVLSLLFGIFSFFSIAVGNVSFSILLLFISIIIDYVDGNLARYLSKTSFFGRFIDGVIDIFVITLFRLGLCYYFFFQHDNLNIFFVFFFVLVIASTPINHFIFDRYSALIRWSNESSDHKNLPYIRFSDNINGKINIHLVDFNYLILFLIPFFYKTSEFVIFLYLISTFLCNAFNIFLHINEASKTMKDLSNENRNR